MLGARAPLEPNLQCGSGLPALVSDSAACYVLALKYYG